MAYKLFCLHVSMRVIKQKNDLICLIKYREYDRQNCTTQGKGTVPLMVYKETLCKRGFVFQDSGIKQVYENGS